MVVIQVWVGKNIVDDVLIDGRASVNKKLHNKVRFTQTKTNNIPP
jgi:hypothetical protein